MPRYIELRKNSIAKKIRFSEEQAKKDNAIEEKKFSFLFFPASIKPKNIPNTKKIGNNAANPAITIFGFSKLVSTRANVIPD